MKKILFLFFLSLNIAPLCAQSKTAKKAKETTFKRFSFGVQAGGSLTNFYSGDFANALQASAEGNNRILSDFTQKALLRPAGGISFTFNFTRNIAFSPEVLLAVIAEENSYKLGVVSGAQTKNVQSIKSVTEINYLQIPLLVQFSFGKSLIRPYIKLGATPAYIIKGARKDVTETQQTNSSGTMTTTSSADQDLVAQKNVNSFQGGLTAAAGLHLGRFIDLESRYDFTISSLNTDANSFYKDAKSRALGVQLGVKF